jgi:hypothetical protein
MIILPRQARDKHRESTQKEGCVVFLQNLTYYALANNAIGLVLDRGSCPSDDLADPVTPEEQATCTLAW